jgi:hypothetical protein
MHALILMLVTGCAASPAPVAAAAPPAAVVEAALARAVVPWIENAGHHPDFVRFSAESSAGTFFVLDQGRLALALPDPSRDDGRAVVLTQTFADTRRWAPTGQDPSCTRVHLSLGPDPARWTANQPTYATVLVGEVARGVELRLSARGGNVEQIYRVRPGADPTRIRARFEGATAAEGSDGQLELRTPAGSVALSAPVAYQRVDGRLRPVEVAYAVYPDGFSFELGPYDEERPLVIDPLLRTSYLGGIGSETVRAMLVHPSTGDVYVAGGTFSTGFVDGSMAMTHENAYVAQLDPQLTEFKFIQYMGGLGNESISHLVVHPEGSPQAGKMVAAGTTDSPLWPSTGFGNRGEDPTDLDHQFVAELELNLQSDTLRYVSGALHDRATDLAIHPTTYEVYLAGETNSTDFPGVLDGAQPFHAGMGNGTFDATVVRLSPNLQLLRQSTFIGGETGGEVEARLAVSADEGVYVLGRTNPLPEDDWCAQRSPVTPLQDTPGGQSDLFVARLDDELESFRMVTFLGGNGNESTLVRPLLDPDTADVYVVGTDSSDAPFAGVNWTATGGSFAVRYSSSLDALKAFADLPGALSDALQSRSGEIVLLGYGAQDLPGTDGTVQPSNHGPPGSDAHVAVFARDLALSRATYLGGGDSEMGVSLAENPTSGDFYVAGTTHSEDFPRTAGGAVAESGGFRDGFVARLLPDLSSAALSQSTYFGGMADDLPTVMVVVPGSGDVLIGGRTQSANLPGTGGAAQTDLRGTRDGFVARFDATLRGTTAGPDIDVVPPSLDYPDTTVGESEERIVTIRNVGASDLVVSEIANLDASDFTVVVSGGNATCSAVRPFTIAAGESCEISVSFVPQSVGDHMGTVRITSNDVDESTVDVPMTGAGVEEVPPGNGGGEEDSGGCGFGHQRGFNRLLMVAMCIGLLVVLRLGRRRGRR